MRRNNVNSKSAKARISKHHYSKPAGKQSKRWQDAKARRVGRILLGDPIESKPDDKQQT